MPTVDLSTPEARRANAPAGLRGKALETFVETGKNAAAQAAEVAAGRQRRKQSARSSSSADRAIVAAAAKMAPKTPTWPKQVQRVRKVLGKKTPLEATGLTKRELYGYAEGKRLDIELEQLRAIGLKTGDPYCSGRRLAATLVALQEEGK